MLLPGLAVTAFGLTSLPSALGEGFEPIRRVGVACRVSLGVMQWRAAKPAPRPAVTHGCPPPSTAAGCWSDQSRRVALLQFTTSTSHFVAQMLLLSVTSASR